MMKRVLRVLFGSLLTAVALTACGDKRSVSFAELLDGVEPFGALQRVGLESRARDIESQRPAASPAAYVGYAEQIGEYKVWYHFPGVDVNENQVPPAGRKRIRMVAARRSFPNYVAALQVWNVQVAAATQALSVPPQCYRVPAGHRTSRSTRAVWDLGDAEFSIVAVGRPPIGSLSGVREGAGVVILELSRDPGVGERLMQKLWGVAKEGPVPMAEPCSTLGL